MPVRSLKSLLLGFSLGTRVMQRDVTPTITRAGGGRPALAATMHLFRQSRPRVSQIER
jgi:hypothetical protein